MNYLIEHETVLEYPATVREHHIELRLVPRCDEHQKVLSCSIETEPAARLASYTDYFGNRVDYFCVIPPHNRLVTRLRAEVETRKDNPFDFTPIAPGEQQEWLQKAIRQSPPLNDFVLHRSPVTPHAMKLADVLSCALPRCDREQPVMENLLELMAWIPSVLEYRSGTTGVHADLVSAVRLGAGVCQDFAHLFITVARSWGLPARYVMGYLDPGSAVPGKSSPPMPGPKRWCRARAGSALMPPTTCWPMTIMLPLPSAGTPTMLRPSGAASRERPPGPAVGEGDGAGAVIIMRDEV